MSYGLKKSLYLFLTAILGTLLFLILHRILVFFYLYLLASNYITDSMGYYQFLALDYITLTFAIMFGLWYGIWLGLFWYKKVYEEQTHGGLVKHISAGLFPLKNSRNFETKVSAVNTRIESDLWALEDLAKETMPVKVSPEPIKRKVVRKSAPKKLNSIK